MDATWFKSLQKKAGLTSFDLGEAIQRDRSVISRIINGTQRMTLEQAQAFADLLKVPLAEMVEKGGLAGGGVAQQLTPGFRESDAAPFLPAPGSETTLQSQRAASFGGDRPGVDLWQVKSLALVLAGYLPGDWMLVDTHQSERTRPGDIVVAQVYNNREGTAHTLLRRHEPPVLVAASPDPADQRVHLVDGVNVVIRGKVIASWRV